MDTLTCRNGNKRWSSLLGLSFWSYQVSELEKKVGVVSTIAAAYYKK